MHRYLFFQRKVLCHRDSYCYNSVVQGRFSQERLRSILSLSPPSLSSPPPSPSRQLPHPLLHLLHPPLATSLTFSPPPSPSRPPPLRPPERRVTPYTAANFQELPSRYSVTHRNSCCVDRILGIRTTNRSEGNAWPQVTKSYPSFPPTARYSNLKTFLGITIINIHVLKPSSHAC